MGFVYVSLVADPERYAAVAGAHLPPDAVAVTIGGAISAASGLNPVLDRYAAGPSIDGLVVLHEDVIIRDPQFEAIIEQRLAEDGVGLVGVIGAVRPPGLNWWDAAEKHGAVDETRGRIRFGWGDADVDVCDGLLHVIGRRALDAGIRYDEGYDAFHGYDLDLCLQVRSAGLRVVVAPVWVDHRTRGGYGDEAAYLRANARFVARWSGARRPHADVGQ